MRAPLLNRLGWWLLMLSCIGVAGYAVIAYGARPLGSLVHPQMRAVFESHALGIYLHVFASTIALVLGPFQFSAALRRKAIAVHRWLGRAYLFLGVLPGGLAGLYMSRLAFGGFVSHAGFALLAAAWLSPMTRPNMAPAMNSRKNLPAKVKAPSGPKA